MHHAIVLAPRQRDCARLLIQGCTDKDIAKEMKVAVRTVKAYLRIMYLMVHAQASCPRIRTAIFLYQTRNQWDVSQKPN